MALVPYAHVLAPTRIYVDDALAFAVGDPIPLATAVRIGLGGEPVLAAYHSPDDEIILSQAVLEDRVRELVAAVLLDGLSATIDGGTP